ncbi:MAG TPA: VWA domain-containing protein [Bryobacteraceae bacterium]|nr:VWA domain-containing protein [Bryobacteraceae bacterium]
MRCLPSVCFAIGVSALLAQDSTIRTSVPLVLVPTTVADHKGRYVNNLAAEDFLVYDQGRLQKIQMDSADSALVPISLVVAVQASDISAAALAKIKKTGSMIQPLLIGERGEAAVLAFDDKIHVLQNFTSDPGSITEAIRKIKPGARMSGRTLDAVAAGVRMLAARPQDRRRVIVLIGESRDRGSNNSIAEALTLAQRDNVTIYPATYSAYTTPFTTKASDLPPPPPDTNLLKIFTELGRLGKTNAAEALAHGTGGARLSFTTLHGLEQVIEHLGEEIHSQYLLSFAPISPEPGFHEIKVEIRNRPDLVVRTRPGYWPVLSVR